MNLTVFKNTFKRHWKLLFIFLFVLCFYQVMIIGLIDPADMGKVQELFGSMKDYMQAFSISIPDMSTPLTYTASVFFSMLIMAFTMVFYVIQATSLIAKQVDDASIACTLSAPVKRTELALTKGVYLIVSMLVLFAGILISGSLMLGTTGSYDFKAYLNLVGVTFMLCTTVAMLSYFLSVAFCGSKLGTALAVGVPVALVFISLIGGAGGDKTEWLKKCSPFGWIDSVGVVNGSAETWWMYPAFGGAIIVLLLASVAVFYYKRLPV